MFELKKKRVFGWGLSPAREERNMRKGFFSHIHERKRQVVFEERNRVNRNQRAKRNQNVRERERVKSKS